MGDSRFHWHLLSTQTRSMVLGDFFPEPSKSPSGKRVFHVVTSPSWCHRRHGSEPSGGPRRSPGASLHFLRHNGKIKNSDEGQLYLRKGEGDGSQESRVPWPGLWVWSREADGSQHDGGAVREAPLRHGLCRAPHFTDDEARRSGEVG